MVRTPPAWPPWPAPSSPSFRTPKKCSRAPRKQTGYSQRFLCFPWDLVPNMPSAVTMDACSGMPFCKGLETWGGQNQNNTARSSG